MIPSGVLYALFHKIKKSQFVLRLARGVFWSLIGLVLSKGLMLIGNIVVARMLEKSEYGELGVVQQTIVMLGAFAGFGLGITATKHVAQYKDDNPERAGRIISLILLFGLFNSALLSVLLFLLAPWLATNVLASFEIVVPLKIGSLILAFSAINGVLIGVLSGFEAFKSIAKINALAGLLSFPAFVLGAYYADVIGCIWALVFSFSLTACLNALWLHKELKKWNIRLQFKNCMSEFSIIGRFSLPAALGGLLVGPVNWATSAIVVNAENGYEEMAIYNAANQWFNLLIFVPNIIGNVILPILSEKAGKGFNESSKKALKYTIFLNLAVVVPMIFVGGLLSKNIMGVYGESYIEGWSTLIVVFATVALLVVNSPVGQLFAAAGKMWIGLIMNGFWALVFIVFTLLMVDSGAFGLALARCIAYLGHTVWQFYYIQKRLT